MITYTAPFVIPSANMVQTGGAGGIKTILYITAAAAVPIRIIEIMFGNEDVPTNEQIAFELAEITTIGSPGFQLSPSAAPHNVDVAATATVRADIITTEPTTYSTTRVWDSRSVASLPGYRFQPVPEKRIWLGAGNTAGLKMVDLPLTNAFKGRGFISWIEYPGV